MISIFPNMGDRAEKGPRYDPVMASKRPNDTRDLLARIIISLVAVLAGLAMFVVILQRPLGISTDGIRIAERIFFASLAIAFLVAQFYFPRPRFPRKRG